MIRVNDIVVHLFLMSSLKYKLDPLYDGAWDRRTEDHVYQDRHDDAYGISGNPIVDDLPTRKGELIRKQES